MLHSLIGVSTVRRRLGRSALLFMWLAASFWPRNTTAEGQEHEEALWKRHPHHLSIVLGGTFENGESEDESGTTVGIDYEYRLNEFLGIGGVLERAFGALDITTALAVVDLHVWRGLVIQTGPGLERTHDEEEFVFRVGGLYEFERDRWTISPQLHLDVTEETESLIFVVAFGVGF